jgi:hypothetical protein
MKAGSLAGVAILGLVACGDNQQPGGPIDPEVTRFVVTEGDSLHIIGVNANEATVGTLDLEYGRYYDEEWAAELDGTIINITVHGETAEHHSLGRSALNLPVLGSDVTVHAFLLDARLASVLGRWQVKFAAQGAPVAQEAHAAEVGYHGGCWQFYVPCGPYECNEHAGNNGNTYQDLCCPGPLMVQRACTGAFQSTNCGPAGPNGCAVCWSSASGGCSVSPWGYVQSCSHNSGPCQSERDCCFDGADGSTPGGVGFCSGECLEEAF